MELINKDRGSCHAIGLLIYRLVLCTLVLKNLVFYLPSADELFGLNGIFPYDAYVYQMNWSGLSHLAYSFKDPQIYLGIMIIVTLTYAMGFYKDISGMILFIMLTILKLRNSLILDGSDNVIYTTLPFLIIAESRRFTARKFIMRWMLRPVVRDSVAAVRHIVFRSLQFQVCLIYFFTAIYKLQGDLWINGTAVYYAMRLEEFRASSYNVPLTENHYFVVLSTYFTMLIELAFPFLVWFRKTKFFILVGGVLLHVFIWIFMRIDNFSWIMIGTYAVFIGNNEYETFFQRARNWYARLRVPSRLMRRN